MTARHPSPRRVGAARRALVALVGLASLAPACGGGDGSTAAGPAPVGDAAGPATTPAPTTTAAPTTTTTIDPGTLEQTRDKPDGRSPELQADGRLLFGAIVADAPDQALSTFFPRSAYLQVKDAKAVGGDAAADWERRLVGAFRRDVASYRRQLGANAPRAAFVRVDVPDAAATWMGPGTEYNKIGYWRVLNAKLVYTVDGGKEQSLPIASMISWRGRWYVVHLGPF